MGLTRIAITRPVFIFMCMCLVLLFGIIAYRSMRVELNPDVSFGLVTITTVYPGASPDEVNTLVTRPIEEVVSGVANLQEVTSTSQEGVSSVAVRFEIGADQEAALNEVRSKVDSVVGELPREIEKPIVDKFDTSADPVLTMILRSKTLSNRQLRDLAENKLKDQFARVKGVANVSVGGGEVREIQVRLRPDKLEAYRLGIIDVRNAVQNAALNVPSGRIVAGDEEYTVRMLGEFKTPDQIGEMWVSLSDRSQQNAPVTAVKLRDIATIVDTNVERRSFSRLNGSDSVSMVVQKAKAGNAVEISSAIRTGDPSLIERLEQDYGIEFVVTTDAAKQISESLFDVQFAIGFGVLLVMAVIFVFLHNLRGMLIVAVSIPLCIFATLVALWAFGFTINNLSMLAISLAVGVMVDDSIVVIENIYRHLTMGEEPVEASINGRSEIGLAAIAITLADVVVFLPIGFMGGIVGQFYRPLGIGYAVAVMLSLLVSFTVTPMLASRWYRKGEDWEHPQGRFARWFERNWHRFSVAYRNTLAWCLDHRWFVFNLGFTALFSLFIFIGGSFAPSAQAAAMGQVRMIVVTTVIGLVAMIVTLLAQRRFMPQLLLAGALYGLAFPAAAVAGFAYGSWKGESVFKFAFLPPSDAAQVLVNVDLPTGSSLAATSAVVKDIEEIVMKHPQVHYVVSSLGSRSAGFGASSSGTNFALLTVTLYDKAALLDRLPWSKHDEKLRYVSDQSVAGDLLQQIGKVPGARVTVTAGSGFGFGAAIQMSFRSDDRERLLATAEKVRELLAAGAIKGVVSPDLSSKAGKPELRVVPDRARMAYADVSAAEVGGALRVMYEGDDTTKFRTGGQEYDIRVMMDRLDRDDPETLAKIPIAFRRNDPVYLTEVASIERGRGLDKIDRRDRQEEILLSADLLPGYAAGTVQGEIDNWMKKENLLPEQVTYRPLGQADAQAREVGYLFGALGLGLILVYMVLASLYDNLLYPFIIQLAQPQAMVGAILALVLTDKAFNIIGFIGIIALVGLVGKNAILLVDYANTLRARGFERREALLESGQTRLRPIWMTTLALVVGMLPIALAIGRGSEFRETIGITIIGGTILSTILSLLIIPCSYTIFDDLADTLGRVLKRRRPLPTLDEPLVP
ncbi:MAG: efflux RND transporter permease subunit [Fimbriimonadaceae bacterium]|nr:efflux RND transporter permease subunit [Fimbriimonadaceae bacterium]QYK55837.1 MAG: efflux RND transporter permease subunit [Fimbriimonadaceae bacterium]